MSDFIRVVAMLVSIAACGIPVQPLAGQARTLRITGKITDPSGEAIAEAQVQIRSVVSGTPEISATTEGNGNFTFAVVASEAYDLRAKAPGFKEVQKTIRTGTANAIEIGRIVLEVESSPPYGVDVSPDYRPAGEPTSSLVRRSLDVTTSSPFHGVDFENFTYSWPVDAGGVPSSWKWVTTAPRPGIRLLKGTHPFVEAMQSSAAAPEVEFYSVTFGDLTGDGRDEAAVDLLYHTGGTANWHYLYVYTLAEESPKLLGILRSGSRADGGLIRVGIHDVRLVLDFADPKRRIADCCSAGWIRVNYLWTNGQFVETGGRTHGDLQ